MAAKPRYVPSGSAPPALRGARWHRSSHSTGMNNCVEAARVGRTLAVRDSKRSAGPVLLFSPAAWSAFLAGLRGPHGCARC
ncbi:hypothetical protein BLA24_09115 [Streptomyces cinnamoneus]|uniref:DUF397 domain-containing protein n=1 Tax=Streptomyces cinnamoneus TaxID=53446 RepID=A0A2G1XLI7_STRCJ|nr:DUF397 domain-containing protein [Streptomyces cinnamoneus]PHQ52076.1 hypothetical protein BLA24_09115 [Streptomyces cinnamoneus]PPT16156.1 DUF397 domain-containing protein [Streptomyces cinnamoneus]